MHTLFDAFRNGLAVIGALALISSGCLFLWALGAENKED